MKKNDIFLLVGVVVVILLGLLVVNNKKGNEVSIDLPVTLTGEVGTREITYSEYEELVASNKPFMIVIVQTGCSHCQNFEPVVDEVATEKGISINYLNLTNMSEEEYNSLSSSNSYLKRNNWGTPTSLIMQGEKIIDSLSGEADKEGLIDFLEENVKMGEE